MTHLSEHPHAFVKDGIVTNVAVFDSHDSELLALFAAETSCELICCCDHGMASIGDTWDGITFSHKVEG
jgi:hypothetical protein